MGGFTLNTTQEEFWPKLFRRAPRAFGRRVRPTDPEGRRSGKGIRGLTMGKHSNSNGLTPSPRPPGP